MSKFDEIINRLEQAEGANYNLELEIAYLTDFWEPDSIDFVSYNETGDVTAVWFKKDYDNQPLPPNYTASVDAAVQFLDWTLPGWYWRCGRTTSFPSGWAHIQKTFLDHCDEKEEASCADGRAATPAIALMLAALKALKKQESEI